MATWFPTVKVLIFREVGSITLPPGICENYKGNNIIMKESNSTMMQ